MRTPIRGFLCTHTEVAMLQLLVDVALILGAWFVGDHIGVSIGRKLVD